MNIRKSCFLFLLIFVCLFTACKTSTEQASNETSSNNANGYEYKIKNNEIKIISHYYEPTETHIIVPEEIDGKPVTCFGNDAFYQHKNTISIIMPESLKTIDGSPFYRCYSLEEITIPKNVNVINSNPFFRCSSLTKIIVDTNNENYSDEQGVLFNKEKTLLIAYPEGKTEQSYTIPKSVNKLNIDSFGYHTKLKKLTIPSTVTDFPDGNMFVFPDDIILFVEEGSMAEQYAKDYGLKFEFVDNI